MTDSVRSTGTARGQDWLQKQKDRLTKVQRDYLVLQDLLQLEFPPDLPILCPYHLGILYQLDEGHKGKVGIDDLVSFVRTARNEVSQKPQSMLLDGQIRYQAMCLQQLWRDFLSTPGGVEKFVAWITRFLELSDAAHQQDRRRSGLSTPKRESSPRPGIEVTSRSATLNPSREESQPLNNCNGGPNQDSNVCPDSAASRQHSTERGRDKSFGKDTIASLHGLLQIEDLNGTTVKTFIEELQIEGERRGLAQLADESMDQLIPKPVVLDFLKDLAVCMSKSMNCICSLDE